MIASGPAPHASGGPRGARRIAFLLAAVVLVPAAILLASEAALRLAGYGYAPPFLRERTIDGVAWVTSNPQFGWRFFPRAVARPGHPLRFPKEKADGVVRVFVLGGSAALGDPQPTFGMSRYVQAMLEARRPDLEFEVLNAGMTAINSHVVLPIARDCLRYDPDFLVVYLGNNEFVGPFGAGSVFGVPGAGLPLARAVVAARATRLGQLLDQAAGAVRRLARGGRDAGTWRGMEFFLDRRIAADDPRRDATYRNFRRNLQDIAVRAGEHDVPLLLCTVGVNLADCAPFASGHRPDLREEELARWQAAFDEGVRREAAGDPAAAVGSYDAALRVDGTHAELRFRLARCLLALDRAAEAAAHADAARELDTLRFRADEGIHRAVADVAAERAILVDARGALAAASDGGLPGADLFDDHVHLTPRGNHVVAREVVAALLPRLPAPAPGATAAGGPLPDLEACRERIGHTAFHRSIALGILWGRRARPPFAGNLDAGEWSARIDDELARLEGSVDADGARELVRFQRVNLRRHSDDWDLRRAFAELLQLTGDAAAALAETDRIAERFPFDATSHLSRGALLQTLGREDEALAAFRLALEVMPGLDAAREKLCEALVRRAAPLLAERPAAALPDLEEAVRVGPESAEAHHVLGGAYLDLGRPADAVRELRAATRIAPDLAAAHKKLGDALLATVKPRDAVAAYSAALRINPRYVLAIVGLGDAYEAAGDVGAARRQYREALWLRPDAEDIRRKLATSGGTE